MFYSNLVKASKESVLVLFSRLCPDPAGLRWQSRIVGHLSIIQLHFSMRTSRVSWVWNNKVKSRILNSTMLKRRVLDRAQQTHSWWCMYGGAHDPWQICLYIIFHNPSPDLPYLALSLTWALGFALTCFSSALSLSLCTLCTLAQVSHLLRQLYYCSYLCQFNSDLYETSNFSSCATNQ